MTDYEKLSLALLMHIADELSLMNVGANPSDDSIKKQFLDRATENRQHLLKLKEAATAAIAGGK